MMNFRLKWPLFVISLLITACAPSNLPKLPPPTAPSKTKPGEINIEIKAVNHNKGELVLETCFPLLNRQSDMALQGLSVESDKYSGELVRPDRASLKYLVYEAGDVAKNADAILLSTQIPVRRCDTVTFYGSQLVDAQAIRVSVAGISLSGIPESVNCETEQSKLDAKQLPIQIECFRSNGMYGVNVVKHPANMSQAEAERLMIESVTNYVAGPWQFEISLAR